MCVRCIAQCVKFVLFEVTRVSVQYFVWKVCKWCLAEMWTLLKFEQTDCYKPLIFFHPSLFVQVWSLSRRTARLWVFPTLSVSPWRGKITERRWAVRRLTRHSWGRNEFVTTAWTFTVSQQCRHVSMATAVLDWLTLLLARRSPICLNVHLASL